MVLCLMVLWYYTGNIVNMITELQIKLKSLLNNH
jgi:hypothetical protein